MNLASLYNLEEAAEHCAISQNALMGWVASGHAPHYFVSGEGPYFKRGEIAKWVEENLVTSKPGMPVPKRIDVLFAGVSPLVAGPPMCIANIDTLCHLPLNGMLSAIYFLCKGDEVVYVGQSTTVVGRIVSHINERIKDFDPDRVFYLPCPTQDLDRIEKHYIGLLQPKYNGNRLSLRKMAEDSGLILPSSN